MRRTLKVLLLSISALVLALGAQAPAVQAEPLFHSSTSTTSITIEPDGTGKEGHQLLVGGASGSLTCTGVHLIGQLSGTSSSSVEVGGSFSGCTLWGFTTFPSMGECTFTFHSTGTFDIGGANCSTITFGFEGLCMMTIGPQSTRHEVTYQNLDANTITAEAHVEGIHGVATGAGCPSPGTFTNGGFTGNTLITSTSEISVE